MDIAEFTSKYNEKLETNAKHMTKEQEDYCHKKHIETHTLDELYVIPMEEMAELTQHLSKLLRKKEDYTNLGILEELADVQICLDNLKIIMGINEDAFQYAKEVKYERNLKNAESRGYSKE